MSWSWLTQSRSAINILQAHLQLYNFTVSTGSTWEGCKTKPQKASAGPMWGLQGFAEFTEAQKGAPLLFTQTPTHAHTDSSANSPKQRPKVHFPCLFFKLTAQLQLFKPFCIGGAGAQLKSAVGKGWRVLSKAWGIYQDLPWFLKLVLMNT